MEDGEGYNSPELVNGGVNVTFFYVHNWVHESL